MTDQAQSFLPRTESFLDCTGKLREFVFRRGEQTDGVLVRATELAPAAEPGYEFSVWSATIGDALGRLREKIRLGLARRYIAEHPQRGLQILGSEVGGRIASGGIVIDGRHVPFAWFVDQLQMREGLWITARITDPAG